MGFSEKIKLEVKRKADWKCCRCKIIGIEVHHIIPLKDGGTDDIDNAAPLCPNCHSYYGDNPQKRKEITQMRDWWYDLVEKMYPVKYVNEELLNRINTNLEKISINQQETQSEFLEVKVQLRTITDLMFENMKPGTASAVATGVINTYAASGTTMSLNDLGSPANVCPNCGAILNYLTPIDNNICPMCRKELY